MTPTTVVGTPPTRIVRPTTPVSPPKCVRHASKPRSTTAGASACASASTNVRPSSGGLGARRSAVALSSAIASGTPGPSPMTTFCLTVRWAPRSVIVRSSRCQRARSNATRYSSRDVSAFHHRPAPRADADGTSAADDRRTSRRSPAVRPRGALSTDPPPQCTGQGERVSCRSPGFTR